MKYAYVTVLSSNDYYLGVIGLFESLKKTNPRYIDFVVIINEEIDEEIVKKLQEKNYNVIKKKSIDLSDYIHNTVYTHWMKTFDKFNVFSLTEYDKVVYLDSDLYIVNNIDDLFLYPHMTGVISGKLAHPEWDGVNSGVLVIEPDETLLNELIKHAIEHKFNKEIGDQDVINSYFDWHNKNLAISEYYNLFSINIDYYINNFNFDKNQIKIIHFAGGKKPWMMGNEELEEYVNRLNNCNRLNESEYLKLYMDVINQNKI